MKKELAAEVLGRAAELARAFAAGFARAPEAASRALIDLLAIRLGDAPHALRLAQVAGLYARRAIVPLPSSLPELLGLVSLRAAIVPVYDLAALLGRPAQQAPRWLVLAAAAGADVGARVWGHGLVAGGWWLGAGGLGLGLEARG